MRHAIIIHDTTIKNICLFVRDRGTWRTSLVPVSYRSAQKIALGSGRLNGLKFNAFS